MGGDEVAVVSRRNHDGSFDYRPLHLHQWEAALHIAVSWVPKVAASSHVVLKIPLQCVVFVSVVEDLLSMGLLHLLLALSFLMRVLKLL